MRLEWWTTAPWRICWLVAVGAMLGLALEWCAPSAWGLVVIAVVALVVADLLILRVTPSRATPEVMPSSAYILLVLASIPWCAVSMVMVFLASFTGGVEPPSMVQLWNTVGVVVVVMHPMALLINFLATGSARPRRVLLLSLVGMVLLFPFVHWGVLLGVSVVKGAYWFSLLSPFCWCPLWLAVVGRVGRIGASSPV